jgi:hypothetical protein
LRPIRVGSANGAEARLNAATAWAISSAARQARRQQPGSGPAAVQMQVVPSPTTSLTTPP